MMLLISMAITVAYVASMATSLELVRPRLLVGAGRPGHDHAARPLAGDEGHRPGPGALAALAELLPDEAERVAADGQVETVSARRPARR